MVNFENGTLVKGAYVVIDGVEHEVHMPEYSGNTPLSSENLNKIQADLQQAITDLKGTVLYENSVGSIEEITLNDSVAKYDRVKIFYHYNNIYGSTEVDNPNEKTVSLNVMFSIPIYNLARAEYKNIKISGNQITNEGYGYLSINTSGTSGVSIEENKIYITKVIGYKEA